MQFCKEYNAATQDKIGTIIPVEITVYEVRAPLPLRARWQCAPCRRCSHPCPCLCPLQDRSFTFILKTPPASVLLKKAAGVESGSGEPNRKMVGSVTAEQVKEIANIKLPDLNCDTIEAAMQTIAGTARNMGISIEGELVA